jgi:thiol-disulfide isomerase/thioredoxin
MRMDARMLIGTLLLTVGVACAGEIGRPAPPLVVDRWLSGRAPEMRGKPLLVRFWTVGCLNCRDSAETLAGFHRRYGPRGLVVIGVHHPKSERAFQDQVVRDQAKEWGMDFALAQDTQWRTVKSWWTNVPREKTSATFLVDGRGIVRHLHPGGSVHASPLPKHAECDKACKDMDAAIQKVLSEREIASAQ